MNITSVLKNRFSKDSNAFIALVLSALFTLSTITLTATESAFPLGIFAFAAVNFLVAMFVSERLIGWFLKAELVAVVGLCIAVVYLYPS